MAEKNKISAIIKEKFSVYWPMIKSLQTGLLLVTGITGYVSAQCPVIKPETFLGLVISLFLTISGSTILNMVYDRDIDAKMPRTAHRPLPSGKLDHREAFALGSVVSLAGLALAFYMSFIYGVVVFAGLFTDAVVYTVWLKRKTAWSIIWGGISGGMPILAGRVLGTGSIDFIGILLSLAILLWIPTHILTFSMRYHKDYQGAGIPTFPSTYGNKTTRVIIALSSVLAAVSIGMAAYALGISWGYLRLFAVLTVGIIGLSLLSVYKPSEKINFGLFKYASLYMLSSMALIAFGSL
jgi:protoheme IX farnesyltransferase